MKSNPVRVGFRHCWILAGLLLVGGMADLRASGTVTQCDEPNLRAAMVGGGRVTFACSGTITLSNSLTITQPTTFVGTGQRVVLSGGGRQRVFLVNTGIRLTLIDLTVADGLSEVGAGIVNMGGTLELSGVTISNNVARREANYGGGGGIYSTGATRLTNCLLVANQAMGNISSPIAGLAGAGAYGGAICHFGTELIIESCTFTNNSVAGGIGGDGATGPDRQPGFPGLDGGAGRGGAVYIQGPARISRSSFVKNAANGGRGGIGGTGGVGEINGSGGPGGWGGSGAGAGVFLAGNTLTLTASTFSQNVGVGGLGGTGGRGGSSAGRPGAGGKGGSGGFGLGGGLAADSGTLRATNNTWAANQTQGGVGGFGGLAAPCGNPGEGGDGGSGLGGAVYNRNAAVVFVNNTVTANTSTGGRGNLGAFEPCVGVLTRANSGVPGVGLGAGISCETGSFSLLNSVLAWNQPGGDFHGPISDLGFNISSDAGSLLGVRSLVGTDPMLGPLTNNGGPTLTMALQPGSPAIDFGNHENGPPLDQRGISRAMGLTTDAGAYELEQPVLPRCDEAILQTGVGTGGVINLTCDGTFLLTQTLLIARDTVIDGAGHSPTISGRNLVRVFHVQPGVHLTLQGVNLVHGRSTNGAGIYNEGGTVTLLNCVLSTNVAAGRAGPNGRAGLSQGNTSAAGGDGEPGQPGGDGLGGAVFNAGLLRATNTSFLGNVAQGGSGGDGGGGGNGGAFLDQYFRCTGGGPGGQGGAGARGGDGLGGAVFNTAEALLSECFLLQNQSVGGNGGGGGMEGRGGCDVPGARAGEGGDGGVAQGGTFYNLGVLQVLAATLAENKSVGGQGGLGGSGSGGGVSSGGEVGGGGGGAEGAALVNEGTNVLVNTTLAYNRAVGGDGGLGGPFSPGYSPNAARSGNGADASGGAIDNWGWLSALNCSIWDNEAWGGSGLNGCTSGCQGTNGTVMGFSLRTRQEAVTALTNTILGNRFSTNNCYGVVIDGGHNICSDASAAFTAPGSLNQTDPCLGPLANHGGPVCTLAPLLGSPAIDAANDLASPAVDQRGVSRPQGVQCDIGAVEMRPEELPSVLSLEVNGSDGLLIRLLGQPRVTYRLLGSDAMNSWTTLSTNDTGADGRTVFTQPQDASRHFYRAVTP